MTHAPTSRPPGDDTARLLERLVAALELKEEADPDCPAWVAEQEIHRLERQILAEWHRQGGVLPGLGHTGSRGH